MSLPMLELAEIAVSDFCSFIGLREEMLRGLVSVGSARLEGSTAPAWLLEYRLADFSGLELVRSSIPIPDSIARSAPARQASFLFGRVAARAGVRGHLGGSGTVPIGSRGAPIWPEGLSGSISHTDTHAVSWVERREAAHIGIDLERRMSQPEAQELCGQVMSAREAALLSTAFSGDDWPEGVTLLFSAKEAAYKALSPFVERYMDFHEIELDSIDLARWSVSLRNPLGLEDEPKGPARVDVRFASVGGSILTYAVAGPPATS